MKEHQMTLFTRFYELFSVFVIPISKFKAKNVDITEAS